MAGATVARGGRRGQVRHIAAWAVPRGMNARLAAFALLLLAAVGTLALLFQVPYRATIAVGSPAQERRVSGFHAAEGQGTFTYRWTTDRAAVRLPLGIFPGEASVVLSGDRPGSDPPPVALAVGDAPPVSVRSSRTFTMYPLSLPATAAVDSVFSLPTLTLIPANTAMPTRDNRALGVAVERVVVYTNPLRFGLVVPPPLAVALILGMAATLAALVLSLAPSFGSLVATAYAPVALAAGYVALRRADDPGEQARAVAGFTVAAVAALLLSRRRDVAGTPWARWLSRLNGRWLVAAAMLVSLGYSVYAAQAMYGQLYDDAYITLRYARNFADGHGLVYNPGALPVEGYTNFSLTVLLAAAAKLGLPLPDTARVLGILAAIATVAATYRLTSRVLPGAPGVVRAVPSLVLAGCGWFAFFAAIGLETHLFALAVTLAACFTLERRYALAGLVFALASLTRPEGAGLWAVTLVWLLWGMIGGAGVRLPEAREQAKAYPTRILARFALPFALVAGGHELFRLLYYGVPVPNTFYAKVGTGVAQLRRGADYLLTVLPTLHPVALALLIAVAALLPSRAVAREAARYLALLAAAFAGYVALVGGDFIGPRFLVHLFPVFVVLALAGIQSAVHTGRAALGGDLAFAADRRPPTADCLVAALVALWFFLPLTPPGTFLPQQAHMRLVTGLTALGQYLHDTAPPGATLAIEVAGVVPYASGLPTLDMLGLNDAHIARTAIATGEERAGHEKQDPQYVLAQQPTFIAVGMTPRGRPGRGLDLPGFDAQYRLVALVRMNATAVSPDLVLPLTATVDTEAAMRRGYTYALYQRRDR